MSLRYRLNPLVRDVEAPPIAEAQKWAAQARGAVLDAAQAVPSYPPPAELRRHLAAAMERDEPHFYTDIFGIPELRRALAEHMSDFYGGHIDAEQVGITAGCNQAFCLAVSSVAGPGDEVVLPVPYYFNHQMWLDMQGIRARHLPCGAGQIPDPEAAAGLINARTRALVLVSPNNPTGAVYPAGVIDAFRDLARDRGIALILDETYKDFLPDTVPPHELFRDPDWPDSFVQLYSFSKAYSLTGHRVGSLIGSPELLDAVARAADCVTICPPHPAQIAALYGLRHLAAWREENRRLMADRLTSLKAAFKDDGLRYELVSAGAYFAYVRHPFQGASAVSVARQLARHGVLCLPGSAFGPGQEDSLRMAFANLESGQMPELVRRLRASQEAAL